MFVNNGACLLPALAGCLLSVAAPVALGAVDTPVSTQSGLVLGAHGRNASISVYKGIPYAAPPVGDLRWKPPASHASWSGVRVADHVGNTCAQPVRSFEAQWTLSEDCLNLNIWSGAPVTRGRPDTGELRPVLVWIFGGGYMHGSASLPVFDGEALAAKGIVLVTVNYRLGPFGFLATPQLSAESPQHVSGNYALLDMIAALRWVQHNIAAFGGDPTRVTLAGQSSGAGAVLLLAQSALAKGLFRAVIAQSGARAIGDPTFVQSRPLASAEQRGVRFAAAHGAGSLQQLRALSTEQILAGVQLDKGDPGEDGDASLPVFRPAIDGWVLPLNQQESYARGLQDDIPVMAGFNGDEMGAEPHPNFTLAALRTTAERDYGPLAGELLKLYPASDDSQAVQAQQTLSRDRSRASTHLWATAWRQKTHGALYLYFWTHRPPGPAGAAHGAELPFVFDNLDRLGGPWTDADRQAAEALSTYWVNFVTRGDPNGPTVSRWPAFDGTPYIMTLDIQGSPRLVAPPDKLDFMRRFFAAQKPW